ncbi:hypothetical protein ACIHCQ_09745 [Streptomyces sp. NPDC052236]|uniref:hypothetical protein n=1 Tax=Streptomyces sp. NPDC052236 TaxID=3365686 RepID=UPI0037D1683F
MMITGSDFVFVARAPVSVAIERFLDDWLVAWPWLRVASGAEGADGVFFPWVSGAVKLPEETGHLLVTRDEAMVAGWDDTGYALDSRQEGPFSLMYEPVGWESLDVMALSDPYRRTGFGYEPYEISVVGAGLQMVTVVAPESGPFQQAVLDRLLASFGPPPSSESPSGRTP